LLTLEGRSDASKRVVLLKSETRGLYTLKWKGNDS